MKVETHNHPTAISPHPGAATGSGGEIRDEGATGRGAKPKAGLTGFSVSNLRIPGAVQPWEIEYGKPTRIASPLDIMLEGPLGGAAFNNEFGRPNLCGYFRTFELAAPGPAGREVRGYHKPIMLAGGLGNIRRDHVKKLAHPAGGQDRRVGRAGDADWSRRRSRVVDGVGRLGRRLGFRIGAARQPRDAAALPRGDRPRVGARRRESHRVDSRRRRGGLSNALPELVNDSGRGAIFSLRQIPTDEPGMSPLEIWCNEAQERYVLGDRSRVARSVRRALSTRALPLRGGRHRHR